MRLETPREVVLMMGRHKRRGAGSLVLLGLTAFLAAVALNAAEPAAPAPDPAKVAAAEAAAAEAAEAALGRIDELLQGEEDVFLDTGYTYDPGDRRDPFRSLLAQQAATFQGNRPPGIPGLLIDEVRLTGIFRTGQGFIAQIQAADKDKSHLLKVGDQLFDGDVVSINRTEVVFKKIVNDPTRLKPFMEVVKKLSP